MAKNTCHVWWLTWHVEEIVRICSVSGQAVFPVLCRFTHAYDRCRMMEMSSVRKNMRNGCSQERTSSGSRVHSME